MCVCRSRYLLEKFISGLRLQLRDFVEELVRRNGVPITWKEEATKDLHNPLASTWKDGEDPKHKHEELVQNYVKEHFPHAAKAEIEYVTHWTVYDRIVISDLCCLFYQSWRPSTRTHTR